jgi:hypothetical protein
MRFNFFLPADFSSLSEAVIVTIPDASETVQWDLYMEYGLAGEVHTASADAITNDTLAVTVNEIEELDISAQMDEPGASDYIGLLMESDTTNIMVFGLRIKYS